MRFLVSRFFVSAAALFVFAASASALRAQSPFPSGPVAEGGQYEGMVAAQASANGVPVSLVRRVIMRESRYNAHAAHAGNYGLMQIRLGTARAMGYGGSATGLLDPSTNLTYAVRYLAGAYRAAGGSESRAVALYSRGYYQEAKAQGFSAYAPGTPMSAPMGLPAAPLFNFAAPFAVPQVVVVRHAHRHAARSRVRYSAASMMRISRTAPSPSALSASL